MKMTFLLKNKTAEFYKKLGEMSPEQQRLYLQEVQCIAPKIGDNDTLRERIELNTAIKKGKLFNCSVLIKRRGFNLLVLSIKD